MLHIHITVKESSRLPQKNKHLWPYTKLWLLNELAYLGEPADVLLTLTTPANPSDYFLPAGWRSLRLPYGGGHEHDLRRACEDCVKNEQATTGFTPDRSKMEHVLLQLTQPVREPGLIRRALRLLRKNPDPVCIVGAQLDHTNSAWRTIEPDGSYGSTPSHDFSGSVLVDGSIYAWRGDPHTIFSRCHAVPVLNSVHSLIDIDTAEDIPHALPSLWAHALLSRPAQI